MQSLLTPTPNAIRGELEKILASPPFANSNRSRRFLRYAVESSLKDEDEPLKESVIAMEVFDRGSSYDPSIDSTVRVEAGRLRSRLRDYYGDAGRSDPVIIEIPRGAYRAKFLERTSADGLAGAIPTPAAAPSPPEPSPRLAMRPLLWGLAAVLAVVAVVGIRRSWNRMTASSSNVSFSSAVGQ
jgi:hypothetical protein